MNKILKFEKKKKKKVNKPSNQGPHKAWTFVQLLVVILLVWLLMQQCGGF